jgi:hypothetical protein
VPKLAVRCLAHDLSRRHRPPTRRLAAYGGRGYARGSEGGTETHTAHATPVAWRHSRTALRRFGNTAEEGPPIAISAARH